jgi:hypothetical protein
MERSFMNGINTAVGIPGCKNTDPYRGDADERRFFWENRPGKTGPES